MPPTVPPSCRVCIDRRTLLKGGALGAAWVALPACDQRPLSNLDGEGGNGGAAQSGAGGSASVHGSGGAPGSGGSAGGASGTGAGGAPGTGCTGAALAVGNAAALAVGNLQIVGQIVLGRDAVGVYAMSNVCTHQGCAVGVIGAAGQETLSCPCHGSAFDANGAVTRGPARTALAHYRITAAADGSLSVCVGSVVPASTRTPLP